MSGGSYNYIASELIVNGVDASSLGVLEEVVEDIKKNGKVNEALTLLAPLVKYARELHALRQKFDEEANRMYEVLRAWEWFQSQDSSIENVKAECAKALDRLNKEEEEAYARACACFKVHSC